MHYCTPEQAGISSRHVLKFYQELDARHLSVHSVILSRGDKLFSECYYAPFHKDFKHRLYSATKSFTSIAIGFCEQDGLLSLDDPLGRFFPEYPGDTALHQTTIRELLTMRTTLDHSGGWFAKGDRDRAAYYFDLQPEKYAGTLFSYDSAGSFMLGAVVEKVTGRPMLKYLQEKAFNDIGFSKDAYCLQCPGGYSWADSGIVCTTRDFWRFARFVLNKGTWDGKRYLNEAYITQATTMHGVTDPFGFDRLDYSYGYGYQFWGAPEGCFAANGLGNQIAICDPAHDLIFVINADNQGNKLGDELIYGALFRNIIAHLGDALPEDPEAKAALDAYVSSRKLFALPKKPHSALESKIAGKTFRCEENDTGIRWFRLEINGDEGAFVYENAQGEKTMPFGFGYNVFAKFPQEGYSDLVGAVEAPGNRYDAAFSADWANETTLRLRVQIIDKYFGNLSVLFGFRDENKVTVHMEKSAEKFLNEYTGLFTAEASV